jgi:hypothetical protein
MTRRRWPDVVLVLGILALLFGGIWVLWGQDIRDHFRPPPPELKRAPAT